MITDDIPLDQVDENPRNPRSTLGHLGELAHSLRASGLQVPIMVQPGTTDGRYEILAGHRRVAAARHLKWPTITAVIRETRLGDADQIALMITENAQRDALSTLEVARGYQTMLDLGLTPNDVAKRLGISQRSVRAHLGLVRSATPEETAALDHKQISTDDLIELSRFDRHPELHASVAGAIGTDRFDREVAYARATLDREKRLKALRAQARTEHPTAEIIDDSTQFSTPRLELKSLYSIRLDLPAALRESDVYEHRNDDAAAEFEEALAHLHAECPHHAVRLNPDRPHAPFTFWCLNYRVHPALEAPERPTARGGQAVSAPRGASQPEAEADPATPVVDRGAEVDRILSEETLRRTAAFVRWIENATDGDVGDRLRAALLRSLARNSTTPRAGLLIRILGTGVLAEAKERLEHLSVLQLAALDQVLDDALYEEALGLRLRRHAWSAEYVRAAISMGWEPGDAMRALLTETLGRAYE
ncbi:ParB/RepB/Spo0J family partition protein [Micrococcales bacterium 31B]|nr:ParB/RepB/Spo0J family partition protein [Micrococcales bacterium 31B]